jgi:hypothetical protein
VKLIAGLGVGQPELDIWPASRTFPLRQLTLERLRTSTLRSPYLRVCFTQIKSSRSFYMQVVINEKYEMRATEFWEVYG